MKPQRQYHETAYKQVKDFEYHGAGIPVIISQVMLRPFCDDWIPMVDDAAVHRILAKEVCTKPSRLSGSDVRFLRQWLKLSMADLADHFGYTAPAVHKWEQRRDLTANMHWSAESQLRLLVLDQLNLRADTFRVAVRNLLYPLPEAPLSPIRVAGSKVSTVSLRAA